ncbi:MAG: hypothetical protein ABI602_02675 [Candidatus Saccharibacteria bacterium]
MGRLEWTSFRSGDRKVMAGKNYMSVSELIHVESPWQSRFRWLVVFVVLFAAIVLSSFVALNRIRTYSLPTGGVQLNTQYSQYLVGEPVNLTIKNGFNSPISIVTSCPSEPLAVYRSVNNQWVRIHDMTSSSNCPATSGTLLIPAAESKTVSLANWPKLFSTAGSYRIALQVQYSNALPYVDFMVMTPPPPYVAKAPSATSVHSPSVSTIFGDSTATQTTNKKSATPLPTATQPSPSRTPQTITLNVNSAGNYSPTSLSLHTGDTLKIIYLAPIGNEVRTHFTPTAGTTATISSMTVDSEFRSRSLVLSSAGHWTFRADDHSGNSGSLAVSP